ncbi:hypothetical protein WR25_04738 [Diploscapter pachys]|uniref:Uncharacterized protein n=1 Tax=Diploscapter pachys TaxID=2018661 RepID=A0A2A2L763_9BILA|nr:hypothetical protein WR25_04738 [Diploscapter pachys]
MLTIGTTTSIDDESRLANGVTEKGVHWLREGKRQMRRRYNGTASLHVYSVFHRNDRNNHSDFHIDISKHVHIFVYKHIHIDIYIYKHVHIDHFM